MRILVTGSTGFIGRHLIPELVIKNHQILEITRSYEKSLNIHGSKTLKLEITSDHDYFKGIIIDFKPEIVIHLASFLTPSDGYKDINNLVESNITFLLRILDSISQVELKLFINTGTFAEYKSGTDNIYEPAYLYSATKTASRSFVNYYSKTYNFKQFTVVPYTIYGGADSQKKIIDYLYESIFSIENLDLSPGNQKLDFIHILDIVSLYLHLIENFETIPNMQNIHAGTGVSTSLRDLAKLIEKLTKKKLRINWGGKEYRHNDIMDATANVELNKFKPRWSARISLRKGVNLYLKDKFKNNI
ncbi:NAD-dependent epimerase/dehydratase family protein [Confluentibacter citreus]|uniref:NAD-dependent epimerase/dehydratase family protein n=1 Tax=Confluentibacter citreus TaxID=2007307 RepID=UPI000C282343|nr:NAD(P)-dependent oxidoreductase [Confluentibacter citreus]